MAIAAPSARLLRFALQGQAPFLEVDRQDGLDLLDWLGLGRAEFGAIEASALRPLCRRRLWPEPRRDESAKLRRLASRVVLALECASDTLVHFA